LRFPLSSALCTALAMALAGCTPSPPTAADRSAGEEARPSANANSDERPQAGQGSVTIAGEDAAEDVQQWTPPRVDRQGRSLAQLRRAAGQAFTEGRLYEDADAAIPLWLAVQEEDPDDRQARQGLQRARQRLQQQADALLVRPLKQREALAEASRQALVLLTLAPKDEKVRALQGRVELAQRVVAYNRAGEEDLRADRIGEDGDGAIGNFREALALDENNSRARQGLAAAESGLIRRAEDAARTRDFASAGTWLA
jgi:hypothetical protein